MPPLATSASQLTNKCTNGEEDLEYYIAESGEILGVMGDLPFGERSAKHILFHIFKQIVNYKKQDSSKGEGAFNPAPAEAEGEYYGDDGYGGTATLFRAFLVCLCLSHDLTQGPRLPLLLCASWCAAVLFSSP